MATYQTKAGKEESLTYSELVLTEYFAQHPDRKDRQKSLSDEMLALCAVLDRKRVNVLRLKPGYADGVVTQPTARPRGKRERSE